MLNLSQQVRRLSFLRIKGARQRLSNQFQSEGALDREVIFVSGVRRSGTNTLMEVLERGRETDVSMESDPRAFDTYIMRGRAVIPRVVAESPSRRVAINALCEADEVRRLMADFAPARAPCNGMPARPDEVWRTRWEKPA